MKVFNLLLPLIVVIVLGVTIRHQYASVVNKATKPSESGIAGINFATPVITPLCGISGKACSFPGLYGSPTPVRGIPAPSGFPSRP